MKGIGKLIDKKGGSLTFSLLCGISYFLIIFDFIIHYTKNGGAFLGLTFAPAIICGMALILFKAVARLKDVEAYSKINLLIYSHIFLMIISLVFLYDMISK